VNRRALLGTVGSVALGGCLSELPGTGPPVDASCPDLSDSVESLCSHTADPDPALRPSSWRLDDGAGVSVTFAFTNDTGGAARVDEFPSLKRRVDGGDWEHVWPMVLPQPDTDVASGSTYSWEFLFYEEESTDDADETVELFELDPGTYAAVVDAELDERTVQCIAPFEVGDGSAPDDASGTSSGRESDGGD